MPCSSSKRVVGIIIPTPNSFTIDHNLLPVMGRHAGSVSAFQEGNVKVIYVIIEDVDVAIRVCGSKASTPLNRLEANLSEVIIITWPEKTNATYLKHIAYSSGSSRGVVNSKSFCRRLGIESGHLLREERGKRIA